MLGANAKRCDLGKTTVQGGSGSMIRTGDEYRDSIRDGREVWIDGERVADVTTHPAFRPIVDVRAGIYDMAHEAGTQDVMTSVDPDPGERCAIGPKLPTSKADWRA